MAESLVADTWFAAQPEDRRADLRRLAEALRAGMPEGYEEGTQYGMLAWYVPHRRYPAGYHADPKQPVPFVCLAAQKRHLAVYLMGTYMDPELTAWFVGAWKATGKKLDMGKSCVRVGKAADAALEVLTEVVARQPVDTLLARYEAQLPASARKRAR